MRLAMETRQRKRGLVGGILQPLSGGVDENNCLNSQRLPVVYARNNVWRQINRSCRTVQLRLMRLPECRIRRKYALPIYPLSFLSLFFFICQPCCPVIYHASACIAEFFNVTTKKEKKRREKRMLVLRLLHASVLKLFLISSLHHITVCVTDENAYAVCFFTILRFSSGELFC